MITCQEENIARNPSANVLWDLIRSVESVFTAKSSNAEGLARFKSSDLTDAGGQETQNQKKNLVELSSRHFMPVTKNSKRTSPKTLKGHQTQKGHQILTKERHQRLKKEKVAPKLWKLLFLRSL